MTERDPSLLVIAEVRGRQVAKLFRDSEAHALNYNIINHAPTFFDFVTWPPFCSITHLSKKWPSDKVKENFETNLKVHCVMQLSLSYEVFRRHPLIIML